MIGKCCVFQPFDKGGAHDKRYKEIIEPAILSADLEPYRVDKDHSAPIPIDALHQQIRDAIVCLADISTLNPNVMYELGAAIHGEKPVVIISSAPSDTFPFDIRHRKIIQYQKDSPSDFDLLKIEITTRLQAVVKSEANIESIVTASPLKSTHGLRPQEITALCLIMAGRNENLTEQDIKGQMERAGYMTFAAALALTSLKRADLISLDQGSDDYNNYFTVYNVTEKGEDWLIQNQDGLEMRLPAPAEKPRRRAARTVAEGVDEDDVPF
jgi:hypothetical protein